MCVDYTDLDKHCPKDPFGLLRINQVIDSMAGCDLLCFLDYYSGYHQIAIKEEDQEKTDEDITVLDMTTIACFYYKVNRFLIIIVSNTFDELLLHYDVCWLSFSEIHMWIKKGAQHT
jgi:hypothetical protein